MVRVVYVNSVVELIGQTPVVKLNKLVKSEKAEVLVKLEFFNPGGSIKDRIALNMIKTAEEQGIISPGSTIVEASSGNTGIGLAMLAAIKGYRLILVMPETMSQERRRLLQAYGAELVLTPGAEGMAGALKMVDDLLKNNPDWFMPGQFTNPANPQMHKLTTGPEIYQAVEGNLDYFVAGVGTGGTLSGAGAYLKERIPGIKVVAVEPAGSPVLSGGKSGSHKIQGIGAGFIPQILNEGIIDEIITVSDENAFEITRRLATEEGILCGISSGAALYAALSLAERADKPTRILAIAPDTGERYLSTELFKKKE